MKTNATFLDELIYLIENSDLISDNDKESYIKEIQETGLSSHLRQELAYIFQEEKSDLDGDIALLTEYFDDQTRLVEKEKEQNLDDSAWVIEKFEQDSGAMLEDYKIKIWEIEENYDKNMESLSEKWEQNEIEQIRSSMNAPKNDDA